MDQEQKIYFFWLNIETKTKSSLWAFCIKNGFLYTSNSKANKILIGVFEENNSDESFELIENFIGIDDLKKEKCTTRKNSALAKKAIRGSLVLELKQFNEELKHLKRNNKSFPEYILDDLYKIISIERIELQYRYKFTEKDWEVIDKNTMSCIAAYPYLTEVFL